MSLSLLSISVARAASFSYDLEIYISNSTGTGAQSANFQICGGGGGITPAFAPISVFSMNPFLAISIPLKGFYRNVPAGSTLSPGVTLSTGTGGATIDIGAISGSVTAFPPGSEY